MTYNKFIKPCKFKVGNLVCVQSEFFCSNTPSLFIITEILTSISKSEEYVYKGILIDNSVHKDKIYGNNNHMDKVFMYNVEYQIYENDMEIIESGEDV